MKLPILYLPAPVLAEAIKTMNGLKSALGSGIGLLVIFAYVAALVIFISGVMKKNNDPTGAADSIKTAAWLAGGTTIVSIKVGEDRTFFTLDSSTEINQPTAGTGASSSRQDVFNQFTQTFGDVLEVTPSVSEDDIITLVASPTISRFKGVTTSPDGRLSGPNSDSKATESIIRLRSGETGVMGGFVFTQQAAEKRGIPFAERLPLIGRAFRTDSNATRRTELAILITATLDDL